MASVTLRARGPADPAEAWERYAVPALWSSWAPQIQRVTASTDRLVAGTTGTVHAGLLARPTLPVAFEVLAVDEARREWGWRAQAGPISLRLEHGVSPDGSGASTWLRVHGTLPVVLAYAPLARIALRRLVAA
jgi:polyketide cyclase/dehydrase/lipid transport protein